MSTYGPLGAPELGVIVDDVLGAYVGPGAAFDPGASGAVGTNRGGPHRPVCATVRVDGAWSGTVRVWCSARLGASIASAMLAIRRSLLSEDDIVDSLGEVANMVGGRVKVTMPEPTTLSLPMVTFGLGTIGGAGLLEHCASYDLGESLQVTVLAHTAM